MCACCPGGYLVATAVGGLGPFLIGRATQLVIPVASGLGHAMFVGAVACDLSWRECRHRASVLGVCAWVRWRHARTTRNDALGCADGCAPLREETCAPSRDDAWLRGVSEKLALPMKVDQSSGHGLPCRGGMVKVTVGLPAKVIDPVVREVDYGGCA
ncbi:hypothetical protein CRG98_040407 [Punica granatum]|uniref:Uncharacterized protein n=1 Tax=Punica granatum TaxID=22663 RepID=A0A2I0I5F9_PUNGR|nr:hypothetical protein CRG98_040407 [Punica granatum]